VDVPTSYHSVSFDTVAALPYPTGPQSRLKWAPAPLAQIEQYEGVPLTVEGYLEKIKPQTGSSESVNCNFTAAVDTDWHIALVKTAHAAEKTAIVVETTPRLRKDHLKWTTANLRPWEDSEDPVRISGWLMFDPQHRNHLGRYRQTLWEIHPITKIEVKQNGRWIDVDNLP